MLLWAFGNYRNALGSGAAFCYTIIMAIKETIICTSTKPIDLINNVDPKIRKRVETHPDIILADISYYSLSDNIENDPPVSIHSVDGAISYLNRIKNEYGNIPIGRWTSNGYVPSIFYVTDENCISVY
ncbi:MAG: hypothetical protein GF353_23605 [Candidatus Lokiarchaeota archaeon]|nr:hypothetical protein [Candidatus Lokiarchaeota archaeon]